MNTEDIDIALPITKLNGETLTLRKQGSSYYFNIFKGMDGEFEPGAWFANWKKDTFGMEINPDDDGWCAIFNCMVLAWGKVPEDIMRVSAKKYGVNIDDQRIIYEMAN